MNKASRMRFTPQTLGYGQVDPGLLSREQFLQYLKGASQGFTETIPEWAAGWFLVSVRGGREHEIASLFQDCGIQSWVPETTERLIKIDRTQYKRPGRPRKAFEHEERVLVYNGFILVYCVPSAQTWYALNAFKMVYGIVASGWDSRIHKKRLASKLSDKMIKRLNDLSGEVQEGEPQLQFKPDDPVKVTDGPFASFPGIVSKKPSPFGYAWVDVLVFGRATPVMLEFEQIEKVEGYDAKKVLDYPIAV